jgi:hypothetical protein
LPEFSYYEAPENEYWDQNFIIDNKGMAIFYVPFILLWLTHLFFKTTLIKTTIIYILLLYSIVIFAAVIYDFHQGLYKILPIQLPHFAVLILPLMITYWKTAPQLKNNGT